MKTHLICFFLLTASSSLWATTRPVPPDLPNSDAIAEATALLGEIQGSITGLLDTIEGTGDETGGSLENDYVARNIILRMSVDTNKVADNLEQLDQLVAKKKFADATKKKNEICTSLVKLTGENANAKISADLANVGNLTSSDSQFQDIDSDIKDSQKVLKCN